jgi:hypothetical protein
VRGRSLPNYELLPITPLLDSCHFSLELERKRNFIAKHILRCKILAKTLENNLKAVQNDLLVHVSHFVFLPRHYLENIGKEEKFEVLEVHLMPSRHSFLDGVNELMGEEDDLRVLRLGIA